MMSFVLGNKNQLRRLCVLAATALTGILIGEAPAQAAQFGVNAHLGTLSQSNVDEQLQLAANAGLKVVRWDAPWKAVETSQGQLQIPKKWDYIVDAANAKGIATDLILDYGNKFYDGGDKPSSPAAIAAFVRYATFVAQHFKDRVRYYEIWNEWDSTVGGTSQGTPEGYIALASAVYPAIKSVAPNVTVMVGGFATEAYYSLMDLRGPLGHDEDIFFINVLKDGLLKYGDALAIHPYSYKLPVCASDGIGAYRYTSTIVNRVHQAEDGRRVPIFITEIGWPVGTWRNVVGQQTQISELDQSQDIESFVQDVEGISDIAGIFFYELQAENENPRDASSTTALVDINGNPKASYFTVERIAKAGIEGRPVRMRRPDMRPNGCY